MKKSAQRHSHGNMKFSLPLLFAICYLLFVSCADIFQDRIPSSGKNDSLDNLFRKQEEITKLQTPQQLFVAPYYSSTEIRLTWEGVRGAAYYKVERATVSLEDSQKPGYKPDDGDYEVLNHYVNDPFYTDAILKNPSLDAPENKNKYFYRVSAFNTAKKYDESDPTKPVSAMLFNAPANLKASGGASEEHVELHWEKTDGATSYEIWRSDLPSGVSASLLDTVPGDRTSFKNEVSTAEQGKEFYYMVSAKNGFGNKSPQTKPAYGYARVFGAPGMPVVYLAENSGRGQSANEIKIKWNPADEPEAYYAVYRYSSRDSSLTRLTPEKGTTKTEWSDTSALKPGMYYYYKVQAIIDNITSGKALKSQFSSSEPTESYILSPPDIVVAEKESDNKVTVKWKPAIGSEGERLIFTYNVYADKNKDGNFLSAPVKSGVAHNVDGEGYISVGGLDVSSGAFFKVSTNLSGVESAKSVVVSPAPAAAVIQSATQRAYFSGAAANSNGVYPVKITWKKPANEDPAFYIIQRSTGSGIGFSTINETQLGANGPWSEVYSYDSSTGVYTYTDKNETAKVSRKFYYRVLSLNELEQGNFYSSEAIGYGALTYEQYILEYNKTMGAALKKLTLMYKADAMAKLGSETKKGAISGNISYNATYSLGSDARIIIQLTDYADFNIENDPAKGVYFILNGNSNTKANTSSNGSMDGTVTCSGMYPGKIYYDRVEIKGGAAGNGTYGVEPEGFPRKEINYTILN
jgi:hypothetical protein